MGRITDAVEDIEKELEQEILDLEDKIKILREDNEKLAEEVKELWEVRNWFEAYDDWIRANYPNAPEIYQALNKIKES